jgi:hypothetical protein
MVSVLERQYSTINTYIQGRIADNIMYASARKDDTNDKNGREVRQKYSHLRLCQNMCIFYMPVFMDIYVYIYNVEHIRVCIFK